MDERTARQVLAELRTTHRRGGARIRRVAPDQHHVELDLPGGGTALWQLSAAGLRGLVERNGTATATLPVPASALPTTPAATAALIAAATPPVTPAPPATAPAGRGPATSATTPASQVVLPARAWRHYSVCSRRAGAGPHGRDAPTAGTPAGRPHAALTPAGHGDDIAIEPRRSSVDDVGHARHRPELRLPELRHSRPTGWPGSWRGRHGVWRVLWAWTALWGVLHGPGGGYSWHFFATGARLLTGGASVGGLHLYATHPELQIGPLALLVAVPLAHLDPWQGRLAAPVLLTALGPALFAVTVRMRERHTRLPDALVLTTGLLLLPLWTEVSTHYGHLDDALALLTVVLALHAAEQGRPVLTGLLLAASVDAKPWALGFAALLLALPPARRGLAAATLTAGVALAWLPFVLADPGTLGLTRFTIPNVSSSALRALGVSTATTPSWDRPAQLVLGATLAVLLVRQGRPAAAPLAVIAARLLLDPETYPYYSSGLLVATALLDLGTPERRLPLWTAGAAGFCLLDGLSGLAWPAVAGVVRACYCILVLAALAAPLLQSARPGRRGPPG